MSILKQFGDLSLAQMDRKDFLKYVGGVTLTIIGVAGLIKVLLGSNNPVTSPDHSKPDQSGNGYGDTNYGR